MVHKLNSTKFNRDKFEQEKLDRKRMLHSSNIENKKKHAIFVTFIIFQTIMKRHNS